MLRDPRWYQVTVLAALVVYGLVALDFDVSPTRALVLIGTALAVQWALGRWARQGAFEPKSALISALSLCLLLRTNSHALAALVAAVTIASKFALRVGGKHVFNPTNFGLTAALAAGAPVWVSPGQWGQVAVFGFAMAALGTVVVTRAARADVTFGFLAAYAGIVFARAAWLGQPWANPLHQLANGGLVLFAFFMISDPKTTPDSRAGRLVFAALVAAGAALVTFALYRPNGLLWALVALSPIVPVLDRVLPGKRYAWPSRNVVPVRAWVPARAAAALVVALAALALGAAQARAFCGFYVAQSDAKLYNHSSQVVLARDGDRTVVTLANDYQGDPKRFALVVPVPVAIDSDQVHVGDPAWIERLDKFSAPRLVDYPDPEPCPSNMVYGMRGLAQGMALSVRGGRAGEYMALKDGVTVLSQFTVDEYDIVILSATESRGLLQWLNANGYRVPDRAAHVLQTYIRQGMKFFVAKVNLEKRAELGVQKLRPLQIAYESPRFMLPIRLGMVNANGPQELFVYALTPHGRVETTNYRVEKLPTGKDVPMFVRDDFPTFERAVFDHAVEREGMRTVFLEYAWNAGWCDPCASAPVPPDELRQLGASWLDDAALGRGGAIPVFVTRLHARYDAASFPEDLVFQETANTENYQARYVLHSPSHGSCDCPAGATYRDGLAARRAAQALSLVELTGWSPARVHDGMSKGEDAWMPPAPPPPGHDTWWRKMWHR